MEILAWAQPMILILLVRSFYQEKNTTLAAGHDLNVAGTVIGKDDVNLVAGNNIATTALKGYNKQLSS